jgi:hypothetical protein
VRKYLVDRLRNVDKLDGFLSFVLGALTGVLIVMWLP